MIEWMKNTKPLKEFLKDALREDELDNYAKASKYQNDWICSKYKGNYSNMYRLVLHCKCQHNSGYATPSFEHVCI